MAQDQDDDKGSDGLTVYALKGEAQALQEAARAAGQTLKRSAALETVARRHGFKDWNAAAAVVGASAGTRK